MDFYRFFDSLLVNLPYSLYSGSTCSDDLLTPEQAAICCNYAVHHAPHLLEALLNHCPDPNTFADTFGDDFTLLSEILSHDNVGALDSLLRHGFDPNGEGFDDPCYYTPLEYAFLLNAPCCLARLLAEPTIFAERNSHIEEYWERASDACRRLLGAYLEATDSRAAAEAWLWEEDECSAEPGLEDDLNVSSEAEEEPFADLDELE